MRITPDISECWKSQYQILSSSAVSTGMSSSHVWRLSTSVGDVCLKAWPTSDCSPDRLEYIQRHVDLARSAGISCIPRGYNTDRGEVCLTRNGYLWQASQWMKGAPDVSGDVSLARRESAAKVLARLHHCWSGHCTVIGEAPGMKERLTLLQEANRDWSLLTAAVRSTEGQLGELARRTIEHGRQSASRLAAECQNLLRPKLLHFVIRDVRCEHVLYVNDRVTGVIDYGAARVDDPMLDLVRLSASQSPKDRNARYETLQVYFAEKAKICGEAFPTESQLTISDDSLMRFRDFRVLDETSTVLSALQWLRWLVVEHRQFSLPADKLLNRLEQLVQRLDLNQW